MTQNNNQTEVLREGIDIQQYLTEGVEAIVKDALRATLRDPKESLFMARLQPPPKEHRNAGPRMQKRGSMSRRI